MVKQVWMRTMRVGVMFEEWRDAPYIKDQHTQKMRQNGEGMVTMGVHKCTCDFLHGRGDEKNGVATHEQ
jgi:hypothetical protein